MTLQAKPGRGTTSIAGCVCSRDGVEACRWNSGVEHVTGYNHVRLAVTEIS
jgi:hypothetical protein